MEKRVFDGNLGFWDYIAIAFYTKFAPKKLVAVGPGRATIFALPNGKTFISASPRLQELKPLPTTAPLPMPRAMAMAVIEETNPNLGAVSCTSACPELDDEFEAAMQQRDADELAAKERASTSVQNLQNLIAALEKGGYETPKDAIQEAAEAVIIGRDGQDFITPNKTKE
jgi:hypothetical protein